MKKLKGFIANSVAFAALEAMIVIVEHLFEWTFIKDGLIPFKTGALLAFESFNRDRTKFNPLHCFPGSGFPFQEANTIKTSQHECIQKPFLCERTRNTARPQLWVILHIFRHDLIAYNI